MANTVLYLDPDEPYSVPAALLGRPPSPAKTTLVSRKGKTVPPGGKLVPGVRPKSARNQGKPHPGRKTAAIPADAAGRPFAPGRPLAAWIVSHGDAGGQLPWSVDLGHR